MRDGDLEFLREIFKDTRLHIGIAKVLKVELTNDKGKAKLMLEMLPDQRQVVAEMSWADIGIVSLPLPNDLVLTASHDGHPDEVFVIRMLNTKDSQIPTLAQSGHLVVYSRAGKKAYLGSDTKIGIGKPGDDPTSPLVLGDVLKTFLGDACSGINAALDNLNTLVSAAASAAGSSIDPGFIAFAAAIGISITPAVAAAKASLTASKSLNVDTDATNCLSKIAFTEKGT